MGSTARGLITGFICRLCSKMNRYVILIYGEEGERMGLAEKINSYLPITVNRHDPLPKTVCLNCVDRLETHSRMVQMISKAETKFKSDKVSDDNSSDQDDNNGGSDSTSDEEENDFDANSNSESSEINCQMPGCNLSVDHRSS